MGSFIICVSVSFVKHTMWSRNINSRQTMGVSYGTTFFRSWLFYSSERWAYFLAISYHIHTRQVALKLSNGDTWQLWMCFMHSCRDNHKSKTLTNADLLPPTPEPVVLPWLLADDTSSPCHKEWWPSPNGVCGAKYTNRNVRWVTAAVDIAFWDHTGSSANISGHVIYCRSYSFVCTLHTVIIIIVQMSLKTLSL